MPFLGIVMPSHLHILTNINSSFNDKDVSVTSNIPHLVQKLSHIFISESFPVLHLDLSQSIATLSDDSRSTCLASIFFSVASFHVAKLSMFPKFFFNSFCVVYYLVLNFLFSVCPSFVSDL